MTTAKRCITAQLPIPLWEDLDKLSRQYPGLTKTALIKALIGMGLQSDPEQLRVHLGRY